MTRAYKAFETFRTEKERRERMTELEQTSKDIIFNTSAELGKDFENVFVLEYTICQLK